MPHNNRKGVSLKYASWLKANAESEKFQNASIYNIIRALWMSKVEQQLPQIDQYAILDYYNEKRAKDEARQNIIIWLWNLIKGLFQ